MYSDLKRELLVISALGAAALLLASGWLTTLESGRFALLWLLASVSCWAVVIWQCRKRLPLNCHGPGTPVYVSLGMANQLTLVRGWLIAATAGFLFNKITHSYTGFIPALLYTTASLADCLDGYLARRQQRITLLGTEMDMLVDALGLVIAPLVAVISGKVHASYLLVSAAYYLFQWALHRRRMLGKPVYPLPPSSTRRIMAGFQMGFVAGALYPPIHAEMSRVYGVVFMLPLLAGFWMDWRSVSSKSGIRSGFASFLSLRFSLPDYSGLMLFVRAALIAALFWTLLSDNLQNFSFHFPAIFGQGATTDSSVSIPLLQTGFAVLLCLCMPGIALGVYGRACAVVMIVVLSWQFPFLQLDIFAWIVLFGTALIALFGTGHLSLLHTSVFSRGRHKRI